MLEKIQDSANMSLECFRVLRPQHTSCRDDIRLASPNNVSHILYESWLNSVDKDTVRQHL